MDHPVGQRRRQSCCLLYLLFITCRIIYHSTKPFPTDPLPVCHLQYYWGVCPQREFLLGPSTQYCAGSKVTCRTYAKCLIGFFLKPQSIMTHVKMKSSNSPWYASPHVFPVGEKYWVTDCKMETWKASISNSTSVKLAPELEKKTLCLQGNQNWHQERFQLFRGFSIHIIEAIEALCLQILIT